MPPRRTPPGFRTDSPPLHKTPPKRRPLSGSMYREDLEAAVRAADARYRRRQPTRQPTREEIEAALALARIIAARMAFFAEAFTTAPSDPARAAAIARGRKIRALDDRPGTVAEGAAARRLLRRHLAANGLELGDL